MPSPLALGDSLWELAGILFIVLVPSVPAAYLLWGVVRGGTARGTEREIEEGRSAGTPFAVISVVGSVVLVAAFLTMLLVIAVRAAIG